RHFVEKCAARLHKHIDVIPDEAVEAMMHWSWPGNIAELENFIERSVILSEGNRLSAPLGELREESSRHLSDSDGTLRDKEREHIIEFLRQTRSALSRPSGAAWTQTPHTTVQDAEAGYLAHGLSELEIV